MGEEGDDETSLAFSIWKSFLSRIDLKYFCKLGAIISDALTKYGDVIFKMIAGMEAMKIIVHTLIFTKIPVIVSDEIKYYFFLISLEYNK